MPGRSSSRSSFSRSSSNSTSFISSRSTARSSVSTPSYSSSAPVQQHNVKVEQPGFFSNMIQGFGLGAGQSLAFNLFRSNPTPAPSAAPAAPTSVSYAATATATASANSSIESSLPKEFVQCMKETNNDKDACKHYLD